MACPRLLNIKFNENNIALLGNDYNIATFGYDDRTISP